MFGATPFQTMVKQVKSPGLAPFVVGFTSVFLLSAYIFRPTEEQYAGSLNKRFAKPFIKNKELKEESSSH